jgi:hypothetical protein
MRVARVATGMGPNGEAFHPVRAPMGTLCCDQELSFANWVPTDPLPQYDDHVTHWKLSSPDDSELISTSDQKGHSDTASSSGGSVHYPSHPAFGARHQFQCTHHKVFVQTTQGPQGTRPNLQFQSLWVRGEKASQFGSCILAHYGHLTFTVCMHR